MRRFPYFFPGMFLLVIALSWMVYSASRPAGYVERAVWPVFNAENFLNGSFQKEVEKYLAYNLPSLKYQLYLKNDIYDIINFGQFHAGYSGNIIQGKGGILFERVYLDCLFGYATIDRIRSLAEKSASRLEILQALLAKRHISLLLILAPSKVDFFQEEVPWRYRMKRAGDLLASEAVAPVYAEYMARHKVPFVDCYAPLAAMDDRRMAFPDRGIHWSMYGAAICLREVALKLHGIQPATYPIVEITGYRKSSRARFAENDLAELLNLWPAYKRGNREFYLADFKATSQPVPLVLFGDSFMGQLAANMDMSGYSNGRIMTCFENRMPSRSEFLESLKTARALLLIVNVTKFVQPYFESRAQQLIDYLATEAER